MKTSNQIIFLLISIILSISIGVEANNNCLKIFSIKDISLNVNRGDNRPNTKVHLQYESFDPRKPTILFLPELDGSIDTYTAALRENKMRYLEEKYNLIRLELFGQGKTLDMELANKDSTYSPQSQISVESQLNLILQIMRKLKLEQTHLVGFSYSADIVTLFAEKYPDKVLSLVLTAPPYRPFASKTRLNEIYLRLASIGKLETSTRNHWTEDHAYAMASMMRGLFPEDTSDMHDTVQSVVAKGIPIQVISPTGDTLIKPVDSDSFNRLVLENPDNRVIKINTNHKPPRQNPEGFVDALLEAFGL